MTDDDLSERTLIVYIFIVLSFIMRLKAPESTRDQNESHDIFFISALLLHWLVFLFTGLFHDQMENLRVCGQACQTKTCVSHMGEGVEAEFIHIQTPVKNCRDYVNLSSHKVTMGILQDVLLPYLHNCSAKNSLGGNFSNPKEHTQLRIHCRYFNQRTITDSNMISARANKLK